MMALIIIYFGISFLAPIKSIDFTEKYRAYLNYALGDDWVVENISTSKSFKNFWFHEYYYWQLTYQNEAGDYKVLTIDNYDLFGCHDEDACSDYVFGIALIYDYTQNLSKELSHQNVSKLDNYINIINMYEFNDNLAIAHDTKKLIDSKTGLSFKKFDIAALDNRYYFLELGVLYSSGSNINEYTIDEAKKIINKYHITNAIISAGVVEENGGSVKPIYCLKNSQEVTCPDATNLDQMKYVFYDSDNYLFFR